MIIIGSTIQGDLRVINLPYVLLLNNKVGGEIQVDGNAGNGIANVIANTVLGEYLTVRDHEIAYVIENETLTGTIRVNHNVKAFVQKNIAANDISCWSNTTLNSFLNLAGGNLFCK